MTPMSEIDIYRRLFGERFEELDALLADLPDEALLWAPFETSPWRGSSNPFGLIIAHAVSSTVYLLLRAEWSMGWRDGSTVDGDEGPDEFGPANQRVDYLAKRVQRVHARVDAFLDRVTTSDLDATQPHWENPDRLLSARYDVVHAIEHLSEHIGQAQITRQLWALSQPASRLFQKRRPMAQ